MASPSPIAPVLSLRSLNRATLERQLLHERVRMPVVEAVQHLLGLQAQVPMVPYTAVWSRLAEFEPEQLARPLRDRVLVRAALMRSTVHLVTAADAVALRPRMHVALARAYGSTTWAKQLKEADTEAILAAGRELLQAGPLTRAALGQELAERFPGHDRESMSVAATYLLPVLQVTPRGLWGRSGQATWTTYDAWFGNGAAGPPIDLGDLVLRYLAAFGPASVKDVQGWCSLTRLREVADTLGERLRHYRTEDGADLLDLADASLPDPDTPAPVRFLPEYDNAALGYADRRRIVGEGAHKWLTGGPGGSIGSVLVDGFVRATWALRRSGSQATLEIHASGSVSSAERGAVEAEAGQLLVFLDADADHDIVWTGAR